MGSKKIDKGNAIPRNIPVSALKEFAEKYGYDHVIMFCTGGDMQYVATFGRTIEQCDRAAQFGDKLKDSLRWPESLHAIPSRVHALQCKIADYKFILEKNGIADPYEKKGS